MDQTATSVTLRNPRGFHAAKVDAAGRLKLPAKYQEYLRMLADHSLFATKYESMARIYSNGSYERNLQKLADTPEVQAAVARYGDILGCDVELDPQGRVTLPQNLRKQLKLEDQQVYLRFDDDLITIYSQEQYEAEQQRLMASIEQNLSLAKTKGFSL